MLFSRSRTFSTPRASFSSSRVWLIAILLLAWGLRLYHLGAMSIWWDESLSYDRALHDIPTILSNTIQIQNVTTRDLHPPLYFLFLHFAALAFGVGEFALRTLTTFANLLTVALIYPTSRLIARIGRMQSAPRIGLLAAFFAAQSPFYVWYSQEARPYALVLLWSLLAIYALLKIMSESPVASQKESGKLKDRVAALPIASLLIYLFALAATLFTHYLSFLLLPFHAAVIAIFGRRRREWQILAVLLLGAFGTAFLFLPGSAAELTGSDSGGATFVPLFIMLRDVLNSFSVGVTANLDQVAPLDLFLIALWCFGIASTVRLRRRDLRLAMFSLAFLFLPALALQAGSYIHPLYLNSRHLITISPAFYIGLAFAVNCLAQGGGRANLLTRAALAGFYVIAFVVVTGGAAISLNNLYFDSAYSKDDNRAWSEFLRERDRPGDLLILDAPQAEKVFAYYAPPGLKWISLPNLGYTRDEQERLDFTAVRDAYRNNTRLWFLELHRPVADPTNHIYDLLQRFGAFLSTDYFAGTSTQIVLHEIISGSPVMSEPPAIQHPLALSFGDNMQLLGYEAPANLAAGARSAVRLYWRLPKPSGEDYGVSLRLVDDSGTRWGQWDSPPVGNQWPTSKWPAGEILLDSHDLPVDPGTPPGTYHLTASVYHVANQEPLLSAGSSDGAWRLGDITVTRAAQPLNPDNLVLDHRAGINFGGSVNFIGYDSGDAPLRPGELLPLTLYFQLLNNPGHDLNGRVSLTAPLFAFWDSTSASVPFTLALRDRTAGDIVQSSIQVRVPGDAGSGSFDLRLGLNGQAAQVLFFSQDDAKIGEAQVESIPRSTAQVLISHPMNVRLDDAVEFLGYGLVAPQPLHAGDSLTLTLFWRAGKTMDRSYTVFTHLLDAGNVIAGQNDSRPAGGLRDTTSWTPGETIVDEHSFVVSSSAPPGRYSIEVGMYNAETNTRLPVLDPPSHPAGDRILLQELTVQ